MFEDMGFSYLGPVDGHDVNYLTRLLRYAKEIKGPVLLHVRTVKGKGFAPAEATPDAFHGVSKFHIEDGTPLKPASDNFSKVFGDTLCQLAEKDKRVCAITAAMQSGTGLDRFAMQYPERFFDVGIAEGHAVAMSAGMAKQGMVPVFAVYSSFLQRGYDMLIHDVAIQHLHVIFGIDRAGLVGEDGETHHGIFDVAYLDSVPGMTVLAPSNFCELQKLLPYALYECDGPVAIRYARGGEGADRSICADPAIPEVLRVGSDITLVGYGMMINHLLSAADQLEKSGVSAEVIKITMLTPLNPAPVLESMRKTRRLLVAEDCVDAGSVGRRLLAEAELQGVMIDGAALCNLGRAFVTQGTVAQLQKQCGIDGESLYRKALEVCERGEKAAGCTAV